MSSYFLQRKYEVPGTCFFFVGHGVPGTYYFQLFRADNTASTRQHGLDHVPGRQEYICPEISTAVVIEWDGIGDTSGVCKPSRRLERSDHCTDQADANGNNSVLIFEKNAYFFGPFQRLYFAGNLKYVFLLSGVIHPFCESFSIAVCA